MKNGKIYGAPSSYPRTLLRKAIERLIFFSIIAAIGLVGSVLHLVKSTEVNRIFSLVGFVAVFFALVEIVSARVRISTSLSGIRSEQLVSHYIESKTNYNLIKGALLKGRKGDFDQILIGDNIVVIETKSGRGVVSNPRSGKIAVDGKEMYRFPLVQARKQSQFISKLTNKSVIPILCVINQTNPVVKFEGVYVTGLKDLGNLLSTLPRSLSPEEKDIITEKILNEIEEN